MRQLLFHVVCRAYIEFILSRIARRIVLWFIVLNPFCFYGSILERAFFVRFGDVKHFTNRYVEVRVRDCNSSFMEFMDECMRIENTSAHMRRNSGTRTHQIVYAY